MAKRVRRVATNKAAPRRRLIGNEDETGRDGTVGGFRWGGDVTHSIWLDLVRG